jgi:hypothetical protein
MLADECPSHARTHTGEFLHDTTLSFHIADPEFLDPPPERIYVCLRCGVVPPEYFSMSDGVKAMHNHFLDIHRPADGSPPHIEFTSITNPERIGELSEMVKGGQQVELLQCTPCGELVLSLEDGLNHYCATHFRRINRKSLERRQRISPTGISSTLSEALDSLSGSPERETRTPVEGVGWKEREQEARALIDVPPPAIPTPAVETLRRKKRIRPRPPRVPVPHKRSILKRLAGIEDEPLVTANEWNLSIRRRRRRFIRLRFRN